MAYPARNYEKDPSKRVKGWYMVPGKGRRYWDGKTFRYSAPDGTTNVKDMVGDRLRGLVGRISKGSEAGKRINQSRRTTRPGSSRRPAVASGSPSQAPNQSSGGANNPSTTRTETKEQRKPVSTPQASKPTTKPTVKQTGDKAKDMGAWAKANQKLAQRMVDRYKDKDRKPSGYASVVKALKEIKAKNVKPKSNTKVA